jgi:hypothetical protein
MTPDGGGKRRKAKTGAPPPAGGWLAGGQGWKTVDVGDELLLGAEESGFAGLEVLEDYTLIGDLLNGGSEAPGVCTRMTLS